ncbi:MAG: hypothetical protein KAG97_05200, partial [Victivallales bacterium]|nr:hypothetical protein [Victivallales bacterium]
APVNYEPEDSLFFHAEPAEFVMNLLDHAKRGLQIIPSLFTDIGTFPLRFFSLVCGRCGMWAGIEGDYWWIPGNRDITRIRALMLSGRKLLSAEDAQELAVRAECEGVRLVRGGASRKPRVAKCVPIYDASFSEEGKFEIDLSFQYDGTRLDASEANIITSGRKTMLRDKEAEKKFAVELTALGFKKLETGVGGRFVLDSDEAAGLFLDEVLSGWFAEKRNFVLSAGFAELISCGRCLGTLKMTAIVLSESGEQVSIGFSFDDGAGGVNFSWSELLRLVVKGRSFAKIGNVGVPVRIHAALAEFVKATMDFTHTSGRDAKTVLIPRGALPYWGTAYERYAGEMPSAAAKLIDGMSGADRVSRKSRGRLVEVEKEREKTLFTGEMRS